LFTLIPAHVRMLLADPVERRKLLGCYIGCGVVVLALALFVWLVIHAMSGMPKGTLL